MQHRPLHVMRRVDTVRDEFPGVKRSSKIVKWIICPSEGCGTGERDVSSNSGTVQVIISSHMCQLNDTVSSPRRDVAPSRCGKIVLPPLGYLVLRGPTGGFLFPSIAESICLCREIKERVAWQSLTKSRKLMASVIHHNLSSGSEKERKCCTAYRTREVPCVIHTTPFIRTHAAVGSRSWSDARAGPRKHHLSSWNLCSCQILAPFSCLPNASKVGLDEFLSDVFDVPAPPRCTHTETLCCSLVRNFDPALGKSRMFSSRLGLTMSCPAATATERLPGFFAGHCEQFS